MVLSVICLSIYLSISSPQLFRADLISAMKLPDSHPLEPTSYVEIKEPWRTEWEIGVQVHICMYMYVCI